MADESEIPTIIKRLEAGLAEIKKDRQPTPINITGKIETIKRRIKSAAKRTEWEAAEADLQALPSSARSELEAQLERHKASGAGDTIFTMGIEKFLGRFQAEDDRRTHALQGEVTRLQGKKMQAGPAVPVLGELLELEDDELNKVVLNVLNGTGPATIQALPHVKRALKSQSLPVRTLAIGAIGEMGNAAKTELPELLAILQNKEREELRREAASSIGRIAATGETVDEEIARKALPHLMEALTFDQDLGVRKAAAEAIGKLGPAIGKMGPEGDRAIETLSAIATSRNDDQPVRLMAVAAIGKIGPAAAKAVPALIRVLQDKGKPALPGAEEREENKADDIEIRVAAARALSAISAAPQAPATQQIEKALVTALGDTSDEHERLRLEVVADLQNMGANGNLGSASREVVTALTTLRNSMQRLTDPEKLPPDDSRMHYEMLMDDRKKLLVSTAQAIEAIGRKGGAGR